MQNPRRDNFLVQRAVKRQLERLGLTNAERVIVHACGDCPCCSEHDHGSMEYRCSMLDDRQVDRNAPPPWDCPLRSRALSIALQPGV